MSKSKNPKVKTDEKLASTTPTAPASKLSLIKSAKASKPKAVSASKPGKIDKIIVMMRRPKGASY